MKYKDRNGNTLDAHTSQDVFLEKLYNHKLGRIGLKLITRPAVSKIAGAFLDSYPSSFFIKPFIKKNNIKVDEFIKANYRSYNDFFTRQIKHDFRPIDFTPEHLISPCDGKLSVYPIDNHSLFKIKHTYYSVESLLRSKKTAQHYNGGYCVIIRLTVDDYHRYCYVDNGKKSRNYKIPGVLHTVNPAVLDHVDIYKENAREYTLLKTENFGTIVQVEVGALMVGKINNHMQKGYIHKGFEKGLFEFGGSTIVLLIQPDKVNIVRNLVENTKDGYETFIKMGEKIGEKVS